MKLYNLRSVYFTIRLRITSLKQKRVLDLLQFYTQPNMSHTEYTCVTWVLSKQAENKVIACLSVFILIALVGGTIGGAL